MYASMQVCKYVCDRFHSSSTITNAVLDQKCEDNQMMSKVCIAAPGAPAKCKLLDTDAHDKSDVAILHPIIGVKEPIISDQNIQSEITQTTVADQTRGAVTKCMYGIYLYT